MPSSVTELASTASTTVTSANAATWAVAPILGVVASSLLTVTSAFALLA